MIDISRQKVTIMCPDCRRALRVSLGQISNEELIECSCGQGIQLKDDKGSSKKTVKDLSKSFKNLEKTLKDFGK